MSIGFYKMLFSAIDLGVVWLFSFDLLILTY